MTPDSHHIGDVQADSKIILQPLTSACVCLQPQDDYSVLFEDTSYADGYSPPLNVAQRYVVACKENKKKWWMAGYQDQIYTQKTVMKLLWQHYDGTGFNLI